MNWLTKTLLGGAALSVLTAAPAVAGPPGFHVMAIHAGRVVHKATRRPHGITHWTYTAAVSTYVPADLYRKKLMLTDTFYKFESNSTFCYSSNPPKNKLDKKRTEYAKLGTTTASFSVGCPSGGFTPFYGDTYKLVDKSGFGQTDTFSSTLTGKYKNKNGTYKGTLYMNVAVDIGREQHSKNSN